jgi:ADP-heptose:LPS heptosyltransferase
MADPESPRILVIRRRYLGDIVLLGSFLRNLRLHWPSAEIRVLVEPAYAGVLELNPDVDDPVKLPRRASAWPGFLLALRRRRWTHVFNFDNTEGTALIARFTGAPFRLGLHHGGYRLKLARCYTHVVHDENDKHEGRPITEYYLMTLGAAGVPLASREVRLVPRADDLEALRRIVGAVGPVLLVHPGSRSPMRLWPAERFAEVCDRAQETLGMQVVLAGGPSERSLIAEIRNRARIHVLAFTEPLSLARFAALARLASIVLCHDSGPMHVAAAVGTPVVALYGSQSTVLFRPAGEGHILLQPPLPCADCVAPDTCVPLDSYRNLCVRRLQVDQVFGAVREQLARRRAG